MIPVQSQTIYQPMHQFVAPCDRVSQINLVATAIIGAMLLAVLPWVIAIPANIMLFSGYLVTHFPSTYDWAGQTIEPHFPQVVPLMGGFQRVFRTIPDFVDRHFFSRDYVINPGRAPVGTGERTVFSRARAVTHPMRGSNITGYRPLFAVYARGQVSGGAPTVHPAGWGERALVGRR